MDRQYRKKRAVLGQYSALEFKRDSDKISLNIKNAVTSSGWEIKAFAPPLIVSITTGIIICNAICFGFYRLPKRM